jgi:hypothetical protein
MTLLIYTVLKHTRNAIWILAILVMTVRNNMIYSSRNNLAQLFEGRNTR